MNREGRLIELSGTVQGVGLRPWVCRVALDAGVAGSVRNAAGGVTIEAYGSPVELEKFIRHLARDAPPAAEIAGLRWQTIAPRFESGFRIRPSRRAGSRAAAIPADLPTCGPCLREIFDPGDRRYAYAFTTCTNCGPRFSIARGIPYDRANTSMSEFPMCAACQGEYDSVGSRRFHAETNACPECGPSLTLLDELGEVPSSRDPLSATAEALAAGSIVAIKGLGGYHLACDAQNKFAVADLRARKYRETKPFAVMAANAEAAARLVEVTPLARRMLEGRDSPIVLLPRLKNGAVAGQVAPGEGRLGVLLPYTPVHHLLFARYGRPLVMTSANLADEPTVHRDNDAVERLAGVADRILTHDRDIVTRTDDSVATVVGGTPLVVRRSRGHVPRAVGLPGPAARVDPGETVVAAYGAHLKNACCLVVGDQAYLGPHVGDLETLESYRSMGESIEAMERFLGVTPGIVAHDRHPEYLSTHLALERRNVRHYAIQHHHAHVASAMVENGLNGPVLGLSWDGGGIGDDGTVWGGELLRADFVGFRRIATFRAVRLPGGDLAAREIWRTALAVLDDAYEGAAPVDDLALFDAVPARSVALARRMVATGLNAPASHAAGRWIDAFASIALALPRADHEAQAAIRFEQVASDTACRPYEWNLEDDVEPWQVDLRPTVRTAVDDLRSGAPAATVAARVHETLIAVGADLLGRASKLEGGLPFVVSGGCFQNDRIVTGLERALGADEPLLRNRAVPAGDGGIALGQAAVARARYRGERRQTEKGG
jgi:hydrogenase maturation protein HypF